MKYAKRRDANEPVIIAALEAVGASVQQLNEEGCPDLLVSFAGALHLLEVKNASNRNGRHYTSDGLTKSQVAWLANWKGVAPHIVTNADEALRAVGARRD